MGKPYTDDRKEEVKATSSDLMEKSNSDKFNKAVPLIITGVIEKLNVSEYIRLDKKIKELEFQREQMKPGIIAYMKDNKLKTLSKITLITIEKVKLDAMKVYKFLGFKKFMIIAKVTKKDTEQYLNKIDIGKCASDEITEPEYSLRISHALIE